MKRLWAFLALVILLAGLVPVALAQGPVGQPPVGNTSLGVDPGTTKVPDNPEATTAPEALWPGPDGFGYLGQDVTYSWVDIRATGTAIPGLTDDGYLTDFPVGFTFPYYGTLYTTFDVADNGFIGFGLTSGSLTNQCPLPDATIPNNVIALLWDDLAPNYTTGGVYYQTFASCPTGLAVPCLAVEYYNWNHYGGAAGSAGTWEAILYSGGTIRLQYLDSGLELGSGSTTGIEGNDFAADHGLTYACNTASSIPDGLAIEYYVPPAIDLLPGLDRRDSCPGIVGQPVLALTNLSGVDPERIDLTYAVQGPGSATGPAFSVVPNGATVPVTVTLRLEACLQPSQTLTVTVNAVGVTSGLYDTAYIVRHSVFGQTFWQQITDEPDTGRMDNVVGAYNGYIWDVTGYGLNTNVRRYDPTTGTWSSIVPIGATPPSNYARSGCTHGNTIYVYGDASGAFTGLLSYNMDTNSWTALTPGGTAPVETGIWAPAWVHDPETGYCYLTGGATTPGAGNLATVYVYDPATNAWLTALPNFTTVRDFHAAFIYVRPADSHKLLCVAGGNNGAALDSTQCYDFTAGDWNAENADMGALPEALWGMGYAAKVHVGTEPQMWVMDGASTAGSSMATTRYYDVNSNTWHVGGDTPSGATFRTSATTLDNEVYKIGGATSGFSYSGLSDHHIQLTCPPSANLEPLKLAPATARPGSVISYTIVLNSDVLLAPDQFMADPLPAGVEYAGNLTWTTGMAWYSPTANAVFWTSNGPPPPGCQVALAPGEEPENGELHSTLAELGYHWVDVASVQGARDAGADVIIDRFGAATMPVGDINGWLAEGHGYVQMGDWPQWFAQGWESTASGTPLAITVADAGHPLTQGLPGTWTGRGFWAYGWLSSDAVGWATNAGYPNLVEGSYGTVHQRSLTGTDVGPGRAVYIGFNTYGSLAGAPDKLVLHNALTWSGRCTVLGGASLPAHTSGAAVPQGDYFQAPAADVVNPAEPSGYVPAAGGPTYAWPQAVLWNNGPLVTHPAACTGADASRLQNTSLGLTSYGSNHSVANGYRVADDFIVTDPFGWEITQVTFFAYQTGSPTSPSPLTAVNYRIWDGVPGAPGSSVVFGNTVVNRLLSSTWANIYRDSETDICNTNRPIMADVTSAGVRLAPGHYWIDWQTDGSASYSGPWAPYITILGQGATGDAWQYAPSTGLWGPIMDGTYAQGLPFVIEGNVLPPPMVTFDVTLTAPCNTTVVNEGVAMCGNTTVPFAEATDVRDNGVIELTAPPLFAEICPDSTGAITFTVCNLGDCDLLWTIAEMTGTSLLDSSDPFVPVDVTGQESNPGLTTVSPQAQPVAVPAANPEDVLWDQPLSTVNTNAYVDQDLTDNPSFSSFLADDFANADTWQIRSIFVPGNLWNGATDLHNATALTWQIYANINDLPAGNPAGGGNPPVWTLTLPPNDPQVVITNGSGGMPSDVQLNLATPGLLPPGFWWLVFYPTADFGTFGQYGRQPADTANGYVAQFINPGGGFGLGRRWQDWRILGATQTDIAFRIEGVVVDIPWLSENPPTGAVIPGECQDVGVLFDSTGLLPADYLADLVVFSSDPGTPSITLPVTMTVAAPATGIDFTWSPTSPFVGDATHFTATVGAGTPPFYYTWDMGDGGGVTGSPTMSYMYATAGAFTVTLTVTSSCGIIEVAYPITVQPSVTGNNIYLPIVYKAATR